jgi:transposase-like protein
MDATLPSLATLSDSRAVKPGLSSLADDMRGLAHWRRIRTNNPLERILREIRRRTRVVGAFPDGQSALNPAAARSRHIAGTNWSAKRYLNIELLEDQQMRGAITA